MNNILNNITLDSQMYDGEGLSNNGDKVGSLTLADGLNDYFESSSKLNVSNEYQLVAGIDDNNKDKLLVGIVKKENVDSLYNYSDNLTPNKEIMSGFVNDEDGEFHKHASNTEEPLKQLSVALISFDLSEKWVEVVDTIEYAGSYNVGPPSKSNESFNIEVLEVVISNPKTIIEPSSDESNTVNKMLNAVNDIKEQHFNVIELVSYDDSNSFKFFHDLPEVITENFGKASLGISPIENKTVIEARSEIEMSL